MINPVLLSITDGIRTYFKSFKGDILYQDIRIQVFFKSPYTTNKFYSSVHGPNITITEVCVEKELHFKLKG